MYEKRWQQAVIGLVSLDLEGNMVEVNHAFTDLVGYTKEELVGSHIEKVMNNGSKFFFHSMVYPKLRIEHVVSEIYLYLETKTHDSFTVMFSANLIEEDNLIDCFIVQDSQRMVHLKEIRSINSSLEKALEEKTELHEALVSVNAELKRYAELDFLTGLYNRRVFIKYVQEVYEAYRKEKRLFSVCILDIDHFKQVNDHHGHNIGDAVLVGLAEEMKCFFGDSYTLGRFGGEEFMVLLPESDEATALKLMDQFREHIKQMSWQGVSITLSIGVDTVNDLTTVSDILNEADRALYEAKRRGRDCVVPVGDL